ncbi:cation:proton antiporter [Agrobacterium larrymoorei]|uniref:Cation:proton antiporter n=1 Tax=Agrobacterium larrymoorei TaxID=160699 RepID=A0A4D7DWP6_9HYPH|nr:cation:proton antiporter [Agrobacterium larrymoorei]QCI99239.1 potassium transporter [Agrobacterium larrymoorei]QYA08705.1 cation:proton antiporter [Agrobacterium larrymoorei]QYA08775.1 cation:proton antiporter [Agrobacterium larrymoorei]
MKIKVNSVRLSLLALPTVGMLVTCGAAFAADGKSSGPSEALFLIQIIVLVVVGRLLGEAMVRIGQPSIMGQIIGGILLGPSVFGLVFPEAQSTLFPAGEAQKAMADAVAQLGILFLLLLAGMETDLGLALRLRRAAAGVSLSGIVVPFALGFALGELIPASMLPDPDTRLVTSLFLGTALSISSVKIVASVVREMDFMRRNVGQLIVASAIIDDTIGWVIIALTFSLATSGAVDVAILAKSVIGTIAFMAFSFTIGRRIVFEIIRWVNDTFKSDLPVLSAIIAIMGGMAIITNLIGVHTVLGAFVAGILVGQSPILTRQIEGQLRALTTALFMPVFFGLTGLNTDLGLLADPSILLLAVGLILIASLGKFGGAFAGAKMGGFSNSEAIALGCGMNARGSTEVIVASIGLSVGVLDERLFSVIVAMAVVTTMAMPPTLRWALARLPMREEERDRLRLESLEEKSFLSSFERILLAVDHSASSDLAARIAGHFAAVRKMPITVLDIVDEDTDGDAEDLSRRLPDTRAKEVSERVQSTADTVLKMDSVKQAAPDGEVHVTIRLKDGELEDILAETADKGHDMMFVGVESSAGAGGGYGRRHTAMVDAFSGTTAIVSARGHLPKSDAQLRILVPVGGTERSLNAAEFAFVIAKATGASIAVVYFKDPAQAASLSRVSDTSGAQQSAFEQLDQIATFYGLPVEKVTSQEGSPELAILKHARRGRFNLIILGVNRRAGTDLSYGTVADTLLETADRSVVFVEI